MVRGYSRVVQEPQHPWQLRALQGFHHTEGNGPALLLRHMPQQEVAYKDPTGPLTLRNMYTAPVYKKSFQQIRLTQLLITTSLLRINFKILRSSPSCREKLIKSASVAIP